MPLVTHKVGIKPRFTATCHVPPPLRTVSSATPGMERGAIGLGEPTDRAAVVRECSFWNVQLAGYRVEIPGVEAADD